MGRPRDFAHSALHTPRPSGLDPRLGRETQQKAANWTVGSDALSGRRGGLQSPKPALHISATCSVSRSGVRSRESL